MRTGSSIDFPPFFDRVTRENQNNFEVPWNIPFFHGSIGKIHLKQQKQMAGQVRPSRKKMIRPTLLQQPEIKFSVLLLAIWLSLVHFGTLKLAN